MDLEPQITTNHTNQIEFQTKDQLTTQEILPYPVPSNPLANSQPFYKIDEDIPDTKATQILQANPILPPGKYHLREQPQFRLKFINQRDKFNRTSLALANMQTKSFIDTNHCHFITRKKQQKKQEQDHESELEQDLQIVRLLQHRIEVYRRLNNSKINQIGKEKIMCSFFFDFRKQKLQTKDQPVYQTLARQKIFTWNAKETDWLSFSSAFQSGNLLMVLRNPIAPLPTYELYMQNDINTKGCTQWYYFSVINRSRGKAKLRLMNFYKPTSLYQKGMKVLCSSDRVDWKRTGTAITYSAEPGQKEVYCLQFLYDFDVVNSITYFSYGYPYTYSVNLMHYLNCLLSDLKFQKITKRSNLCISAMGNPIPMVSISNFAGKKEAKPLVYIIGRQHPGQTPASFIVEGLINFLICNCQQAKQLREKYQFRIVPMVNVDGVISGNYRSNLSGNDVNRQWQFPSKKGQPQIYWLKQQIANNKKQVAFFLDIHAHSRKMNSFFYGSKTTEKDNKLLPFICSKLNKFISYNDSSFTDDPSKKTTARVVLENQLDIAHSLTFQVSFYGWVDPLKQLKYSFKQSDLRAIGQSLGVGFYYSLIGLQRAKKYEEPKQNVLPKCQNEKEKALMKKSLKMLQKWNKQCEKQNKLEEEDAYSEGSSLDPEQYQLKEEERQLVAQIANNQQQQRDGYTNKLTHHFSVPKDEQTRKDKRKLLIYSTLSPGQNPQSKLLAHKNTASSNGQANLGISSKQFYHFSNSARGPKKQLFSVRELQLQLQYGTNRSPQKQLRGTRLRMNRVQVSAFDRYESVDMEREGSKNYKMQVLEMKKALKYLLQLKSTDYQNYQSCFKSITGEIYKGN